MDTIKQATAVTLPYLRVDRYTKPFCEKVITAGVDTYHYIANATAKVPVLSTISSPSTLPTLPIPPSITQLYSQGKQEALKFIHETPYINTTFDHITQSVQSIPIQSPQGFCGWVNRHSEVASENLTFFAKNPKTFLNINYSDFFTKSPQKLMVTHNPILTSTKSLDYLHILHTFVVYFIAISLFIMVLNFVHSTLSIILGKRTTSSSSNGKKTNPLYLFGIETFEFSEMKPEWGVTAESWYKKHIECFHQSQENADFVRRVHMNSGLATTELTHLSPEVTKDKPEVTIYRSREESQMYIENLLTKIFSKYNLKPTDIDVLVINCSLFNPTPSHCAMAINTFKMRNDIISYAIHGMGCSASAIAVNCCRDALAAHPKKSPIGIVISFENLTMNFYHGKERGMLVSNALFRLGAAAMVLGVSPKIVVPRGPTLNALYSCEHLIRTHIGSNDEAYRCIWQEEDNDGIKGVRLSKQVPTIAGKALTINVTRLAKVLLPYHELARYGIKMLWCKLMGTKPGAPNFLTAVDHVCIHAGGRGVIDAIEKDFKFPEHISKPSREILYKFGNQSSASIWYIFKHIHPNVTRGQKVWQMTFGSGFKANSLVWKRL